MYSSWALTFAHGTEPDHQYLASSEQGHKPRRSYWPLMAMQEPALSTGHAGDPHHEKRDVDARRAHSSPPSPDPPVDTEVALLISPDPCCRANLQRSEVVSVDAPLYTI